MLIVHLGRIVIADSVNPWPVTRDAWIDVASRAGVRAVEIELVCHLSIDGVKASR